MWVLGIAGSHNSAAALIRDWRVVVAVQTERRTRVKQHQITLSRMGMETLHVIRYCLEYAGIDLRDIEAIATCSPHQAHAAFAVTDLTAAVPKLPPFVS